MMFLVDYNLTGYIVLFQGTLAAEGWLDILSIRFVTLQKIENYLGVSRLFIPGCIVSNLGVWRLRSYSQSTIEVNSQRDGKYDRTG